MATNQGKKKGDKQQNKKKNKQQKAQKDDSVVEQKPQEEVVAPETPKEEHVVTPVVPETPKVEETKVEEVVETPKVEEKNEEVVTPVVPETPKEEEEEVNAPDVSETPEDEETPEEEDDDNSKNNVGFTESTQVPNLEQQQEQPKLNRTEKKVQKAMQKLGLKTIPKITRVTIKRSKDVTFVISNPEVLKSPNSDTYVVIGEVRVEDLSSFAKKEAAQKFRTEVPKAESKTTIPTPSQQRIDDIDEDEDDDEVDDAGMNPDDIALVMSQGNVSKAAAVAALRKSKGDVVNAIMEL